jgi:hypothetical protein
MFYGCQIDRPGGGSDGDVGHFAILLPIDALFTGLPVQEEHFGGPFKRRRIL